MQTLTSRDVQNRYGEFVETVHEDIVCVTRHGRPLYWAVSDRQVRTGDPSVLIARMLLLHGQLHRAAENNAGDTFGEVLKGLDATIDTQDLTPENVTALVHDNRL